MKYVYFAMCLDCVCRALIMFLMALFEVLLLLCVMFIVSTCNLLDGAFLRIFHIACSCMLSFFFSYFSFVYLLLLLLYLFYCFYFLSYTSCVMNTYLL